MNRRLAVPMFVSLTVSWAISATAGAQECAITWRPNLDAAKIEAAQAHKLLLVHFWTRGCAPCRVLDQAVFSQPQVGDALERDFVPVQVDAEASPALASAFRLEQVPTDVILTAQGNVVAMLRCPNTPDAYVGQLQNVARHFRQPVSVAGSAPGAPTVNPAYASLPIAAVAPPLNATSLPQQTAAPQRVGYASYAGPQAQSNPYAATPAMASTHPAAVQPGQLQAAYQPNQGRPAPAAQKSAAGIVDPFQRSTATPASAPASVAAAPPAASPALPANAMPNSYRRYPEMNASTTAIPPATVGTHSATSTATASSTFPSSNHSPVGAVPPVAAAAMPTNAVVSTTTQPTVAVVPAGMKADSAANLTISTNQHTSTSAAASAPAPAPASHTAAVPSNTPPVGFDGCCPVTLKKVKKWVHGDPQFGAVHRGRTYLFVGPKERDEFMANPDGFSPVFAGMDPVMLLEHQKLAPGQRKFGYEYGGSFYLFSSAETMKKFADSPQTFAAGVRQAMNRMDSSVVRR